ncbi:5-(carboxyamino)imidazole ribonucleotide synthase [Pyruvatibacter mobilis]|uniref:5-(carboxyamino)imidazole ribonucleotide synthase n=1 Tax=Pyruvatibacter mobilis TaxID=1712261 RepID=UPI003D0CAC29
MAPLPPGSTIGILGGGQLGRMLAMAGARLGLKSHIYCPDADSPAFQVADGHTIAAYEDEAALEAFAASVDAVTYEFENVPATTAEILARHKPLRPGARALAVSQDRLTEKTFMRDLGIATAPFADVASLEDLKAALSDIGTPSILKTRRFGYDGKGQTRIDTADDAAAAWQAVGEAPSILEGFVDFEAEISVIVARDTDGHVAAYDPARNAHRNHILDTSTVPSGYDSTVEAEARALAEKIATELDYVGVMGVELFVTSTARKHVVNEIAPRVHNSGHWTTEACAVSQFEQHMRAVAGWPLASPARHSNAVMTNLIGDDVNDWLSLAREPQAGLHLYGKGDARPGRKMGHITRISPKA